MGGHGIFDPHPDPPPFRGRENFITVPFMSILWTINNLIKATGGALRDASAKEFSGLSIDTRTLKSGEIFIALKGGKFDGHDFVAAAFKAGATLAIVRTDKAKALPPGPYLVVADVEEALQQMGTARR